MDPISIWVGHFWVSILHDHHDKMYPASSAQATTYTSIQKILNLLTHLGDVALVLADLEKNGITAKPSKSFFAMQRLRVIGLIVSKLGTQVNPDRLQAITEFQMPKNQTAVRRLLGMANQYRNHTYT